MILYWSERKTCVWQVIETPPKRCNQDSISKYFLLLKKVPYHRRQPGHPGGKLRKVNDNKTCQGKIDTVARNFTS